MARLMQRLVHPGPEVQPRWTALPCTATPVALTLPARGSLLDSVAEALGDFDGAWLWVQDAPTERLDYVIPGHDTTGRHVAWYAGPHQMGAGARIVRLGLHLGWREGQRFLHGHGVFAAPGRAGFAAGHIMPIESRLAGPVRVSGWGLTGARLIVAPDPETGFPLFSPQPCGGGRGALLVTARPNQDLGAAAVSAAQAGGIASGRVHGLGSLVSPRFSDGRQVDSFATEILLTEGRLTDGTAQISADVVGLDGCLHSGPLAPGEAGICVTAEMLILGDLPK